MQAFLDSSLIMPAAIFLAVTGGLLALGWLVTGSDARIVERLGDLAVGDRLPRHIQKKQGMLQLLLPKLPQVTEVLLPNDEATRSRLQAQLLQAGIYVPWALSTYFTVKLALLAVPPLICFACGGLGLISPAYALLFGGIIGVSGIFLPSFWLARRRARRHSVLRRSLPDFLDLIVTCLEGGLSMQAGLKQVSEELRLAHPLLASELLIVLRQMELGRTLDQGLDHLAERTGLEELRSLSTFVAQAAKFGSTMADAMRQLADMLRVQREHRAEEQAQKAAVKILFPTLIFIFPTVFVVLAGPAAIQIKEGFARSKAQPESQASDN